MSVYITALELIQACFTICFVRRFEPLVEDGRKTPLIPGVKSVEPVLVFLALGVRFHAKDFVDGCGIYFFVV